MYLLIIIQWRIQDFPDGGGRQPLNLDQKPTICKDFCQKLHENERNWTKGGGGQVPGVLLGSTNVIEHSNEYFTN